VKIAARCATTLTAVKSNASLTRDDRVNGFIIAKSPFERTDGT
jgi:hypothetical protein